MSYHPSWEQLLKEAVTKPGMISEAYKAFHDYSMGNQILALSQCYERGLQPGPISTYPGWQKLGRQVRKGEKAITLCMPVTCKRKSKQADRQASCTEGAPEEDDEKYFTLFTYKPLWFVYSQTDGEPLKYPELPRWDRNRALNELKITEVPFTDVDGNTLGYAKKREIAVSPVCPFPYKTLFHETGHVELLHTAELDIYEIPQMPRNLCEAEAESVALLCVESLGLPDGSHCRGYIQSFLKGENIPEKSAQKIFSAADRILKAGQVNSPA